MDIWAVVVAFNRDDELAQLLRRIAEQTVPVRGVVVVDNAALASTARVCEANNAQYLGSARNLGGAGGFGLGMLFALAQGADKVWLWDDDGLPEGNDCLATLCASAAERRADIVSPLVLASDDCSVTAFAVPLGFRKIYDRSLIQASRYIDGFAHLFNGALIDAMSISRFGIPDYRLFVRGDEVDFMYRVIRSGGLVTTCTAALARHPTGRHDIQAIKGTPFSVVYPAKPDRRQITFRNRAYVFRRHHKWLLLTTDYVRYGVFFLMRRVPDWTGYRAWLRATSAGRAEAFGSPRVLFDANIVHAPTLSDRQAGAAASQSS